MSDDSGEPLKFTTKNERILAEIKKLEIAIADVREDVDDILDLLLEDPAPINTIINMLEQMREKLN